MTTAHLSASAALSEPEVGNYFVSAYPPFSCWKARETAAFRQALDRPPCRGVGLGLYVHIPFCAHRCRYCYYLSHEGRSSEIEGYLAALAREFVRYRKAAAIADRPLGFVYFGGGTPSVLSVAQLRRLFGELQKTAPWDQVREATFECAPRSVTRTKLTALRDAGITRLSLGVQQLDDEVLRRNGRVHGVGDVLRAYERIRRVGFDTVNLDLIVGLVGETDETFGRSLDQVISLSPDSVTIYQLEIPPNTPLYREIRDIAPSEAPAPWAIKRARLDRAFARLEAGGYRMRSAYTAVRDPARGFVYQDRQYDGADLLGLGVASFSYLSGVHQQNRASLAGYLEALDAGSLPLGRAYALNQAEQLVREFVLQLKLGQVESAPLREKFGVDIVHRFARLLARFRQAGWLETRRDGVFLTREGLLRVDRMLPEFYLPQHRGCRYS